MHQPDVIDLTETHHTEEPPEIENYTFVGTKAPATNKSGTGIYIKNYRGTSQRVQIAHKDPITSSRITAHIYNNMYLIEAYAPCQGKRIEDFYEYLNTYATDASLKGLPLLVMGDFNGHIEGWYSDHTNTNGQALIDFAEYWGLEILPTS